MHHSVCRGLRGAGDGRIGVGRRDARLGVSLTVRSRGVDRDGDRRGLRPGAHRTRRLASSRGSLGRHVPF